MASAASDRVSCVSGDGRDEAEEEPEWEEAPMLLLLLLWAPLLLLMLLLLLLPALDGSTFHSALFECTPLTSPWSVIREESRSTWSEVDARLACLWSLDNCYCCCAPM